MKKIQRNILKNISHMKNKFIDIPKHKEKINGTKLKYLAKETKPIFVKR
jgi:hypothetical protein